MDRRVPLWQNLAMLVACVALLALTVREGMVFFKPVEAKIVMGFTPSENAQTMEANGAKLGDYILNRTGVKLETFVAADYTALIEATRAGRVDFAWLAPFNLIMAEQVADCQVICKSQRKGRIVYYSVVIVRADSPFHSINDLRNHTMAWVDPASSSGYIMPKATMMKDGILPDKFFSQQIYAGGHDALVKAVLNGNVDAGATFSNDTVGSDASWTHMTDVPKGSFRVIYHSFAIPSDAMAVRRAFMKEQPVVTEKVVHEILGMGADSVGHKLLNDLYRIDALVEAKTEDYQDIRDAAKLMGISFKK